jgi:cytochrome b6-f complex iron-sulfur subunit
MAETHLEVVKVWIAPGCIVCDSCENDCPEVFDVQEETCLIRPPAQSESFLRPLTPSIQIAAEGCPVEVIKFETKEVEGAAPWANQPEGQPAGAVPAAKAAGPSKAAAPMQPADPKWQALLSNSKVSPSLSAGLATTIKRSAEVNQTEEIVRSMDMKDAGVDWKHIPPDQRAALLSVAGAYHPATPLADRLRQHLSIGARSTRRQFNLALVVAWGAMAAVTATFGAMFQDFFGPKVLKEPKSVYRVGKVQDFSLAGVYEQYKPNGIWVVNLTPDDTKLVALSTTCTHLGCIPNWLEGENKFKCPCHGSGYHRDGVNFEGPTPRPLERYAVSKDPDGYLIVDKRKVFRQELGEWDSPESFIDIA